MLSLASGDPHPSTLGYVLFLGERSALFFGCVASPSSAMLSYGFLMKRGGMLLVFSLVMKLGFMEVCVKVSG